jgi:acetate kinase
VIDGKSEGSEGRGQTIAVINAGSSSVKFTLFASRPASGLERIADGAIEGVGTAPRFRARDQHGSQVVEFRWPQGAGRSHEELLGRLMSWVESHVGPDALAAAGHRVVFGGAAYQAPTRVGPEMLERLEAMVPFMPLHLPHNLAPIRALAATHPDLPQIACFDTAFHQTIPPIERRFAVPRVLTQAGIVRYGFHGLSYEYIATRLPACDARAAQGRTIVAHLGNGASLCALNACRSVGTTMGFSALDGLVMGTRPGWLDPGVLLYLMREKGYDATRLERFLYDECGLLGVSGLSGDMRTLLAADSDAPRQAIDLFCHRVVCAVGSLVAPLGGFDALVFTGGIGENAAPVRGRIGEALAWMGLALDGAANDRGGPRISTPESRVSAWVIPTDEDLMIARHTRQLIDVG